MMATDHQKLIAVKLFDILNGDGTLVALVTSPGSGIVSMVEDNSKYPYVVIGDISTGDFGSHDTSGADGDYTIHTWTQGLSKAENMDITARIYELLHDVDLALGSGFSDITNRRTLNQILEEEDGRTLHGVQQYSIILGGN